MPQNPSTVSARIVDENGTPCVINGGGELFFDLMGHAFQGLTYGFSGDTTIDGNVAEQYFESNPPTSDSSVMNLRGSASDSSPFEDDPIWTTNIVYKVPTDHELGNVIIPAGVGSGAPRVTEDLAAHLPAGWHGVSTLVEVELIVFSDKDGHLITPSPRLRDAISKQMAKLNSFANNQEVARNNGLLDADGLVRNDLATSQDPDLDRRDWSVYQAALDDRDVTVMTAHQVFSPAADPATWNDVALGMLQTAGRDAVVRFVFAMDGFQDAINELGEAMDAWDDSPEASLRYSKAEARVRENIRERVVFGDQALRLSARDLASTDVLPPGLEVN